MITLFDGTSKRISQVDKGDIIRSYDEETKQWKEDRVSSKFTKTTQYCLKLILEDKSEVCCTADHKFYCHDGHWRSYQDSDALR
jgi:ATP-dependent protease HslVU (ClpYQ) peptidase subunit